MGRAVLRQPDGRVAVWSTFVDDFVLYDATFQEYEDWLVEQAVREAKEQAAKDIAEVEQRGSTSRMGRTFESAMSSRNNRHGQPPLEGEDSDPEFAAWLRKHTPEGWQPDPDEDEDD